MSDEANTDSVVDRRIAAAAIAVAVLVAAYTGFRLPNAWSATLDSVSLFGGFHRRVVVGTLLYPLAVATDYDYRLFATFGYVLLAALLAFIIVAAVRAKHFSQRLVIIAWLFLPTGAFLFNEVGYFEQLLYLLLFISIWQVRRGRIATAVVLMSIAPFVHEIAILTVIPIFGVVMLRTVPLRRAVIATLIPAALDGLVLVISAASPGAVAGLSTTLQTANFAVRLDALELFDRTQSASWGLYSVHSVLLYVVPVAIVLLGVFLALWRSERPTWLHARDPQPAWVVVLASAAAIAIPSLLVCGGWDGNRWLFLVISNFAIVTWLSLGYRQSGVLRRRSVVILVVALLFVSRLHIWYFDRLQPRELGYPQVRHFVISAANGSLFQMAKE